MKLRVLWADLTSLVCSIVAVDGVEDNYYETWIYYGIKAFWFRDFLPSDILDAEIVAFQYVASARFGKATADVEDHALNQFTW